MDKQGDADKKANDEIRNALSMAIVFLEGYKSMPEHDDSVDGCIAAMYRHIERLTKQAPIDTTPDKC